MFVVSMSFVDAERCHARIRTPATTFNCLVTYTKQDGGWLINVQPVDEWPRADTALPARNRKMLRDSLERARDDGRLQWGGHQVPSTKA